MAAMAHSIREGAWGDMRLGVHAVGREMTEASTPTSGRRFFLQLTLFKAIRGQQPGRGLPVYHKVTD